MTKITIDRAVLDQALDALRSAKTTMWRHAPGCDYDRFDAAMTGIRAALTAGRAHSVQTEGEAIDIEAICARIKAADDASADMDYMLDSNDCIAVIRGTWKGPMLNDKPDHPQASEPVGINGLTEAETSASMSVRGLSHPKPETAATTGGGAITSENGQASEPAPKGLFIDMIAEHGPEFVAEMASIGEPAPSFERLPKEYEKILHDNAWDLYETGSAEPASSTNDVKQETSEWLSEEYGAAPSTAGEADRLYDAIKECMLHHRLQSFMGEDGEHYPLVDHLSPGQSIEDGKHEIDLICDSIYNTVLKPAALLQSTALPDHPEQHLDMVAALPVGELTDADIARCDTGKFGVVWYWEDKLKFARAILAAARTQPVRKPLTGERFDALVEDLSGWSRYVQEDTAHQSLEKHVLEVLGQYGITQGGKVCP